MSYYIRPSILVMNRQRLRDRALRIRLTYHWGDYVRDILPVSNPALEINYDEFEELPDLEEVD